MKKKVVKKKSLAYDGDEDTVISTLEKKAIKNLDTSEFSKLLKSGEIKSIVPAIEKYYGGRDSPITNKRLRRSPTNWMKNSSKSEKNASPTTATSLTTTTQQPKPIATTAPPLLLKRKSKPSLTQTPVAEATNKYPRIVEFKLGKPLSFDVQQAESEANQKELAASKRIPTPKFKALAPKPSYVVHSRILERTDPLNMLGDYEHSPAIHESERSKSEMSNNPRIWYKNTLTPLLERGYDSLEEVKEQLQYEQREHQEELRLLQEKKKQQKTTNFLFPGPHTRGKIKLPPLNPDTLIDADFMDEQQKEQVLTNRLVLYNELLEQLKDDNMQESAPAKSNNNNNAAAATSHFSEDTRSASHHHVQRFLESSGFATSTRSIDTPSTDVSSLSSSLLPSRAITPAGNVTDEILKSGSKGSFSRRNRVPSRNAKSRYFAKKKNVVDSSTGPDTHDSHHLDEENSQEDESNGYDIMDLSFMPTVDTELQLTVARMFANPREAKKISIAQQESRAAQYKEAQDQRKQEQMKLLAREYDLVKAFIIEKEVQPADSLPPLYNHQQASNEIMSH